MTDFLLELRSEEIPARMQVKAKDDLARLFVEEIAKAGLVASAIETFATPRRLALIARGLPDATEAVREETKGPKVGAPPQALDGFLRKTGLTQDQLTERDGVFFAVVERAGRATTEILPSAIVGLVSNFPWPKSMRWGSQSISTASMRWVRPLQGVIAIFGEEVLDFEIPSHFEVYERSDGSSTVRSVSSLKAGATTLGHRFHHPGPITIGGAHDYVEKLRAAHVIVHLSERVALIREGAEKAAAAAGLSLVADEGLMLENAGLTEWPVPLLGRFDAAFLGVPREVIQLTMRTNQKYFACTDSAGELANAFVCTANIAATDGGAAIVAGNERVLSARLSDAKFFWDNDLKVPLEAQAAKLGGIVFHEKLGTVADKVERVAKLARWLCAEGIVRLPERERGALSSASEITAIEGLANARQGSSLTLGQAELADLATRAAHLCKADLVTGMVGEFPELQGIIGGHLARAQGEDPRVADAIRDHYKPVGQGDDVPTDPVTVAVSLADKLDTIAHFFSEGMRPTGSKDPFALRRAALGVIALCKTNDLRLSLFFSAIQNLYFDKPQTKVKLDQDRRVAVINSVLDEFGPEVAMGTLKALVPTLEGFSIEKEIREELGAKLLFMMPLAAQVRDFVLERLEASERDDGVRPDIIRAAMIIDGDRGKEDDLVRLLARVKALQAFVTTPEGADLLAGYKRAANILKKELPSPAGGEGVFALSYTPESCESSLMSALDSAEPRAAAAIDAEDFEGAMAALATLRAPIDAFFEGVMVNDPDPAKRAARLTLLARFRDAVHRVADFSRIEG